MSARSLNKVILIGNLTRDPELRYTPAGTAVCTFGLATNRSWTTQSGETKEETEFHRIVAWNKLGELCAQLLAKGRKVYVEGRLSSHSWIGQDGLQHTSTEIVIEDMIILDSKRVIKEGVEGASSVNNIVTGDKTSQETTGEKAVSVQATGSVSSQVSSDDSKTKKTTKKTSTDGVQKEEKKKEKDEITQDANENITPDDIPF